MSPPASFQPGRRVRGAGGVELATYYLGGEGPAILLVHATGFHGRCWLPLAPALAEHYTVWAFDQRGHGMSGHAGDGRYDDWGLFAADLLAVVDTLGLADLRGVGHSLGGAALVLAEQARPGTFSGLYLYEPIILPPDRDGVARGENRLSVLARKRRDRFDSLAMARANFAAKAPFSRFHPDALDAYVSYGFVTQPDGTVALACPRDEEASVYEGAPRHPAFGHLPEVSIPVVLAGGGAGGDIGPDVLEALRARLRDARVVMHGGLSHFGPMEAPLRVGEAVSAHFLATTSQ